LATFINGVLSDSLDISDRAIHYGDGLFETVLVRDKVPLLIDLHIIRLIEGCKRLGIKSPNSDRLLTNIHSVIQECNEDSLFNVIKIIVTRGNSERGYYYDNETIKSNILISITSLPDSHDSITPPIKLFPCETRLGINPLLAGLKHLNRLEQVLARNEWDDSEYKEGLLLDLNNNVIEGTMSNLFIEKNNQLSTPELSSSGVNGIARQLIIDIAAKQNAKILIRKISMEDIKNADHLYFCNSVIGVWQVGEFMDFKWTKKSNNLIIKKARNELMGIK